MADTAAIKITDAAGNLIGKVRQLRRSGRRVFEALGKTQEGRYVVVGHCDTRTEAEDAVRVQWLFGL